MRRALYFFILIIFVKCGYTQPTRYGNEWIDYSRTYCKIYVNNDGIYRVPFSLLDSLIPHVRQVNGANFVIVHNGLPVPIYVSTGTSVDSTTYIDFFGKKNIGDVDSVLYYQPGYQPDIYYSLFCDTSVYFLTVNSSTNNPRYTFVNNDTASIPSITEEQYFWFSSHKYYTGTGTYSAGRNFYTGADYIYKSIYDQDEAYGSAWIFNCPSCSPPSRSVVNSLPTNSVDPAGPPATVTVNVFTRTWEQHQVVITFNSGPFQTLTYDNSAGGYAENVVTQPVAANTLTATNTIGVSEALPTSSNEEHLVMYEEILYPRLFQFDNVSAFVFNLAAGSGERYFEVNNFNDLGTQPLLYDVTNGYIIRSTDAPGVLPKNLFCHRQTVPAS